MAPRSSRQSTSSLETLRIDGRRVRLEWHDDDQGDLQRGGFGGVIGALLACDEPGHGRLLYAIDETARVVGAGGVAFTRAHAAHGAVAVDLGWRHHGLGTEMAHRVIEVARNGGVQFLTCRCPTGAADRTAALFGQECVIHVSIGFEQLLVLRLAS